MATQFQKPVNSKLKATKNEGIVNFFSNPHGFGFIRSKDSKDDIFVHINNIIDTIKENDRVIFDIAEGLKGLIAVKVRRLV